MAKDEVVMMAANLPRLTFKLFIGYLRFKRKVKKATKTFRKELIQSGVEKKTAVMLAEEFAKAAEMISIRNISSMF
jgi:hypothetical protein